MSGADTRRVEEPILGVNNLSVVFHSRHRHSHVTAVDSVSFDVPRHRTVGLVGESGSGKSTIAPAVLGLEPVTNGTVTFDGQDITRPSKRERRALTEHLQVIFQDPYSSLSPTRTIRDTLVEPLLAHRTASREEADERARHLLERVGLASYALDRYPSEFSGGQRQRIAIARALMLQPKFIACDEPVSALDLSIQAQVLNLLKELQQEMGLSYLFIAHNLSVVRYMSYEVLVLYRGQLMERGDASTLYHRHEHPYTRALLEASPVADPLEQSRRRAHQRATGALSLQNPTVVGCPFAPRCAYAVPRCSSERPPSMVGPSGSTVACHRVGELPWSHDGND